MRLKEHPPLIYVILDGVADKSDERLNGLTPLAAAHTPNMDEMARLGSLGIVYPVGKGIAPESDVGVFSMLGYDLSEGYMGRGVVEAIGAEVDFKDGDLALRANFATMDEDFRIVNRRAGRDLTREEALALAADINAHVKLSQGAEFVFKPTVAHRAVLRIRVPGRRLSAQITNTDPAYARVAGMGVAREGIEELTLQEARSLDDAPESLLAAELVNEFVEKARKVLLQSEVNQRRRSSGKLEANVILTRDAGDSLQRLPTIKELYGIEMASLVDMPVEKGIAKLTGMQGYDAGGSEDYQLKAGRALELAQAYDAIYIHIKGPDEPGHDGDAIRKKEVIEEIDAQFFGPLVKGVREGRLALLVSADHATPCQLRSHSSDPVPALVVGKGIERDAACYFTEEEAERKGGLGVMEGRELLGKALSLLT